MEVQEQLLLARLQLQPRLVPEFQTCGLLNISALSTRFPRVFAVSVGEDIYAKISSGALQPQLQRSRHPLLRFSPSHALPTHRLPAAKIHLPLLSPHLLQAGNKAAITTTHPAIDVVPRVRHSPPAVNTTCLLVPAARTLLLRQQPV